MAIGLHWLEPDETDWMFNPPRPQNYGYPRLDELGPLGLWHWSRENHPWRSHLQI